MSPGKTDSAASSGGSGGERRADQAPVSPPLRPLSVANLATAVWFNWDGRADSLEAQALGSIEEVDRLGSSRLFVVNRLKSSYAAAYEEAFGPWPELLQGPLPPAGLPLAPQLRLPTAVAAQALATLGDWDLLEGILSRAQPEHIAPSVELSRRAFAGLEPNKNWTNAYASLNPAVRNAVTQVYVNSGRALAAYERTLRADESAFDRFATRLAEGQPSKDALVEGFGDSELTGLKLFLGPGRCISCHSGPLFSDQSFHNVGLAQAGPGLRTGRATGLQQALHDPFNCLGPYLAQDYAHRTSSCAELVTYLGPVQDDEPLTTIGAFKTPSLRTLPPAGPYMHDGRLATLAGVLAYYNELADKPAVGSRDAGLQPLGFTREELAALSSFVQSLHSPVRELNATAAAAKP